MTTKFYLIAATFDEAKTRFHTDPEVIRLQLATYAARILAAASHGQVPHVEAQPLAAPALLTIAAVEAATALGGVDAHALLDGMAAATAQAYALPCPECGGVESHAVWCKKFTVPTTGKAGHEQRN